MQDVHISRPPEADQLEAFDPGTDAWRDKPAKSKSSRTDYKIPDIPHNQAMNPHLAPRPPAMEPARTRTAARPRVASPSASKQSSQPAEDSEKDKSESPLWPEFDSSPEPLPSAGPKKKKKKHGRR